MRKRNLVQLAGVLVIASGCSFSFSVGGLDYEALQDAIKEELDTTYASIGRSVDAVDCPELAETPDPGDMLLCTADLGGEDVRVEVTVDDEDFNVTFNTLDIVYDRPEAATLLAGEISERLGFDVNLNCGDGVAVVPVGDSFLCTAIDADSQTATVEVTANGPGDTSWEIID